MWCPYCGEGHVGFGKSFDYRIECSDYDGGFIMFVSECDDCGKTVFIKAPFEFFGEDSCICMSEEEYQESE